MQELETITVKQIIGKLTNILTRRLGFISQRKRTTYHYYLGLIIGDWRIKGVNIKVKYYLIRHYKYIWIRYEQVKRSL